MSAPVFRLDRVTRDFSDGRTTRRVLKETTFEVMPGELTALAGPSGSGKTTLLTIMGLVLKPSSGRIHVGASDVTGLNEDELATLRLRKYGFVFQQAALVPSLTALDNVLVASAIQGGRITQALRDRWTASSASSTCD